MTFLLFFAVTFDPDVRIDPGEAYLMQNNQRNTLVQSDFVSEQAVKNYTVSKSNICLNKKSENLKTWSDHKNNLRFVFSDPKLENGTASSRERALFCSGFRNFSKKEGGIAIFHDFFAFFCCNF